MHLFKNTISAPYYIFIKKPFKKTDLEIFQLLGLKGYVYHSKKTEFDEDEFYSALYITECSNWVHIIDDWFYYLWYAHQNMDGNNQIDFIAEIGKTHDVFTCMVGDADDTIQYFYYKDGKLRRKYIHNETIGGTVELEESYGEPLSGEQQPETKCKHYDYALNIAASLGIDLEHQLEKTRCYVNQAHEEEQRLFIEGM